MIKKKDVYTIKDKSTGSFQLITMLEYAETLGLMVEKEDNEKRVVKGVEYLIK